MNVGDMTMNLAAEIVGVDRNGVYIATSVNGKQSEEIITVEWYEQGN